MRDDDSLGELIPGAQAGDEAAAQALWNRYFPQLVRLAGKKLAGQRRQMADEEDVAMSVLESFFRAAREGRFPELDGGDGIWRLLSRMTSRKVIDLIRRNAVRPVVGESGLNGPTDTGPGLAALASRDPTPDVLAAFTDEVAQLIRMLPEKYRPVALLKFECRTVPEIARQMGVHVSTIERRLRIIREIWTTRGEGER